MNGDTGAVVTVRNRDVVALKNVKSLMSQIESIERRIKWQRERMQNITQHLSWTHGGGAVVGMDDAFEKLSEMEESHKELIAQYAKEMRRAEGILSGIESMSMRAFVNLTYLEMMGAAQVRERLGMSEYGYKRARRAIETAQDMRQVKWHEKYMTDEKTV